MVQHHSAGGYTRRISFDKEERWDGTPKGLNASQKEWLELYNALGDPYSRNYPVRHMVISFRANPFAKEPITKFDRPIVHCDQILASFVNLIDARHWADDNWSRQQGMNWRLNCMDVYAQVHRSSSGANELWICGGNDGAAGVERRNLFQKNLFRRPVQDHCFFNVRQWKPQKLFNTEVGVALNDPKLRSPIAGKFEIRRTELYCDIVVHGHPVFRFFLEAERDLLIGTDGQAVVGSRVAKGDVLATIQADLHYGELKFRRKPGITCVDKRIVAGDMFSATDRPDSPYSDSLRLGLRAMRRLVWVATGDPECPVSQPMHNWSPEHLLAFRPEDIWTMPLCDEWEWTTSLRAELIRALAPGGGFYLRSDTKEPVQVRSISPCGKIVIYDNDKTQTIPSGAVLLSTCQPGASISAGDPIADWLPRSVYSWAALQEVMHLGLIAQHYLHERAVQPGMEGYTGSNALLPAMLLPDRMHQYAVRSGYLDFGEMLSSFADSENRFLISPPIPQEDWTDTIREANGVLYDARPRGDKLVSNPAAW